MRALVSPAAPTALRAPRTTPAGKIIAMALAILTVAAGLTLGVAAPSHAEAATANLRGMTFASTDDELHSAIVTGYDSAFGPEVVIPGTIELSDGETYTVTGIGPLAFQDKGLTSVRFPDTVSYIEEYAFEYNALTEVALPDSVIDIGYAAFFNNHLQQVSFPNPDARGLSIRAMAFCNNQLTEVTIPATQVNVIEFYAFGMNRITSVDFPGYVDSMSGAVFADNPSLTSVSFGGLPPRYFSPGDSLGDPSNLTVHFLKQYEWNPFSGRGFIFGNRAWQGYTTMTQQTVTFESNGGDPLDPSAVEMDRGSVLTAPTPTRTGYTFTRWYIDDALTTPLPPSPQIMGDITLYAGWDLARYTVEFKTWQDGTAKTQTVDYGATATPPSESTRPGYRFLGWFAPGADDPFDFSTGITGPLTLTERFVRLHTVTFDSRGGSAVAPKTTEYDAAVPAPAAPSRTGYTFTGWYTDAAATAELFDFDTKISVDLTLYAGWSVNSYRMTFDSDGGSAVASKAGDYRTAISAPADPTRAGYRFDGWYATGERSAFDFATPITADLTLTAHWVKQITVTLTNNNGTGTTTVTVDEGEPLPTPPAPSRAGHTFVGWYTDPALTVPFDPAAPVVADVTLYAKWQINSYLITFRTDGKTLTTLSIAYGATIPVPADPKRAGYAFLGWYTVAQSAYSGAGALAPGAHVGASGPTKFDFATPVTGSLTLYAHWKAAAQKPTPKPKPAPTPTPTPKNGHEHGDDTLSATGGTGGAVPPLIGALLLLGGAVILTVRRRAQEYRTARGAYNREDR